MVCSAAGALGEKFLPVQVFRHQIVHKDVVFMVDVFMALLSFQLEISTPSLPAQGEQRRSS